ncbi:MAG: hypothetical protein IPF52_16600 [Saprospiraceae bacterium]|nr:hypothetical protein [Saprospiraceae bacterium]
MNFGVTPTGLESGGISIVGLTNDYDNDVRPGPAGSVNGGGFFMILVLTNLMACT